MKQRLKTISFLYSQGIMDYDESKQVLDSYVAHLSKGHTFRLRQRTLYVIRLRKS